MIFVDSNIPMYLVAGSHPHKGDAERLLERAIALGERLVSDVEVFQEIALHVAVMNRRNVKAVMTFDEGFDLISGIERLH